MKLIFGYDSYDGGKFPSEPNGFSHDYENGVSAINLGFMGYNAERELQFLPHYSTLKGYCDITLANTKDLNEPYFYVIDVYCFDFWHKQEAEDIQIGDKVLQDLRSGLAKILVLFVTEYHHPNSGRPEQIMHSWGEKYNLPDNSIVVVTGSYTANIKSKYCRHLFHSVWENNVTHYYKYRNHTKQLQHALKFKKDRRKLFLCYNRRPRLHRKVTLNELYTNDLLKHGIVSFGVDGDLSGLNLELKKQLPLTIDDIDLNINQANNIPFVDFANTYVSIVTETEYRDHIMFTSEKIFKPIVSYHPFFVVSSCEFLKSLRDMGYQTFSKWFDESYDLEENMNKRVYMICQELKRLLAMTDNDRKNMLIDMYETLDHNYQTFIKRTTTKRLDNKLLKELQ